MQQLVLRLDGATPYLDGVGISGMLTTLSLGNPYTIYLLVKPNTVSGGSQRMIQSVETNRLISTNRGSAAVYSEGVIVGSILESDWVVGTLSVGAESRFYLNNVDITEDTTLTGNWNTIAIGASGLLSESMNAKMIALLCATSVHDLATRTTVVNYLLSLKP